MIEARGAKKRLPRDRKRLRKSDFYKIFRRRRKYERSVSFFFINFIVLVDLLDQHCKALKSDAELAGTKIVTIVIVLFLPFFL